jgi:hypothetical protein
MRHDQQILILINDHGEFAHEAFNPYMSMQKCF